MTKKIYSFLFLSFLFFFIMFLPYEICCQETTSIASDTLNVKTRTLLNEFNWSSDTSKKAVRSAIYLAPALFQEYAIEQFRNIFNRELSTKSKKEISLEIVNKALEELIPPESQREAKEILGIIPKQTSNIMLNPKIQRLLKIKER